MDAAYYHDLLRASEVPQGLHEGIVNYLVHGLHPGSYLTAVLSNQLTQAVSAGDETSLAGLVALVRFLYMSAPAVAWGSESNMDAWIAMNRRRRSA